MPKLLIQQSDVYEKHVQLIKKNSISIIQRCLHYVATEPNVLSTLQLDELK